MDECRAYESASLWNCSSLQAHIRYASRLRATTMKQKELSLDLIQRLYFIDNLSQEEIARKLNVSQWMISNRMRAAGLKSKARTRNLWKRKYSVDERAFKKLS